MTTTKLILKSGLSPGDIVMLTAAVRDLHAAYPGEYVTDARTPCPALWEHNPLITKLTDDDPEARVIEMHYPLIGRSNQTPHHFIHGYRMHLEKELGRPIPAGDFKGDIHLSAEERGWMSQVEEIEGQGTRFWIIVSGGKTDFTAKIWETARFQEVVDRLAGKVRFVQVGEGGHQHPPLRGVLDLRGKTDLRQLVRLVHHADGVVCPVTSLMHLAAAVPTRNGQALRPCVVIAGGREPSQWEAYPGHRYLDTIGALPCCGGGGCWKSRVVALGDGDKKDESLCARPVATPSGQTIPQCLDLVTVDAVVKAVESYLVVPVVENVPERAGTLSHIQPKPCGGCGSTPKAESYGKDDPRAWGPGLWQQFHDRPTLGLDSAKEPAWLARFTKAVPCADCRKHFTELLEQFPPALTDVDAYFEWTVKIHNAVNARLGKPAATLETARALRMARFALRTRTAACLACEHYARATATTPPLCKLAGEPLAFRKDLARSCPAGKWGAVERPLKLGVVIGTFAALPYVHLQLEAARRLYPQVPILVHDDGSPQSAELAQLCQRYGADFIGSSERKAQFLGDLSVYRAGILWAQERGIEYLLKLSRRWIWTTDWTKSFRDLVLSSDADTVSHHCLANRFGFRTECVGFRVSAWLHLPAWVDQKIAEDINIFVEHDVHRLAEKVAAKGSEKWKAFDAALKTKPDRRGYAPWPLMGDSRHTAVASHLWHNCNSKQDYAALAVRWGLPYTAADFADPNAGCGDGYAPRGGNKVKRARLIPADRYAGIFEPLVGKRVAYVPFPGNWGDRLIDHGAQELFAHFNVAVVKTDRLYFQDHGMTGIHQQIESPKQEGVRLTPQVLGYRPDLSGVDYIVVAGGGSMGTFYKNSAAIRAHLLTLGKPVIVLPSTFTDADPRLPEFAAAHAREHGSLQFSGGNEAFPDMAFAVTPNAAARPTREHGLFLRHDSEARFKDVPATGDPHHCGSLDEYLGMAQRTKVIVTDCLHFAIAGLYFGRDVTLLPGSIHKNRSMWETWLRDLGAKWQDSP